MVTDTGGRRSERWFIRSEVVLAGQPFPIDISLTDRRHMLFPMLLGRTALFGRFAVDPMLSYTQPRRRSRDPESLMKIAILSRNTRLYSTQRLVEAARERGHVVRVLDPLRCYVRIAPGNMAIRYKGKALRDIDAVIPRIGTQSTFYGTAVLRQLEMMGVYTPNPSDAVLRARDKLRCLQILASHGCRCR